MQRPWSSARSRKRDAEGSGTVLLSYSSHHPYLQYWLRFAVGFAFEGLPFGSDYNIHVNLHADGYITWWFGSEKKGSAG
jgi:hypothetical protein